MSFTLTVAIIAVTVLISYYAFNNPGFKHQLLNNPYTILRRKEYYRLLTSGFIHADFWHLFVNMWVLYMFGSNMEATFKYSFGASYTAYFIGLYIVGIIVANIPNLMRHKDNPGYNSLGASGGVASVVFASIILMPLSKLMIFPIPFSFPAWVFAFIYVAYSIYMDRKQVDNVDHFAHLWGAIWGVFFIAVIYPGSIGLFFNQIINSFR